MSQSAPNSAKQPFKPRSFNAPVRAQSSSFIVGSSSGDDTSSSKVVITSHLSRPPIKKTLGVATKSFPKVEKRSSQKKDENEQIAETAKGERDLQSEGTIPKKNPGNPSKKTQNKEPASSTTNKIDRLPTKKTKVADQQSGRSKLKKELFPDNNKPQASSSTPSNPEAKVIFSSLKDLSANFSVPKPHSLDSDSSCSSSRNSSRDVTPIRELVQSVPWGIYVTPQREAVLEEFKRKFASISGSTCNLESMKNTPTFSDNSNPMIDSSNSGFLLKKEPFVDGSKQNSNSLVQRISNSAPVTTEDKVECRLTQKTSNSAPIITEVSTKDNVGDKKLDSASLESLHTEIELKDSFEVDTANNEPVCFDQSVGIFDSSTPPQEDSVLDPSETKLDDGKHDVSNDLVTSTENIEKNSNTLEDFLQAALPKQLYSHDTYDVQTLLGPSGSITLVPSSISQKPACTFPIKTLSKSNLKSVVGTSLKESDNNSKISKPVFRKPTNSKSVKKSKDNKVLDATKESNLNLTSKKSPVKNQKPVKEKKSLPEKRKTVPKNNSTKSSHKSPVKGATTKGESSVQKSKDACQTPAKIFRSSTAQEEFPKSHQKSSRKRTSREISSSQTRKKESPRKGLKRAKKDKDVSAVEVIELAVSKAGKIGQVPKYVNNHKLTQRERIKALHKLRNVGVWIQCCNSKCSKWRYVDDIKDPVHVPHLWYCRMNPDPHYNSCAKPEQEMSSDEEADLIENSFTAGSVVWARVSGFPYWPAMVEDDPELEQYYWLDDHNNQKVTYYHVTFFDSKGVTRAWVPTGSVKPFTEFESRSIKKLVGKHASFSARINAAKNTAFEALEMDNAERLAKYSFIARYTGPIKKKKIGLCVPGGVYDSSSSELSSESQNSTDSDFVDESPNKNDSECSPHAEASNDSGLDPSPIMNKNADLNTNPRNDSDRTEIDFPLEENVPSLHNDSIATKLQKLDQEKSETSSVLSHEELFNEVTSSQDLFAPEEISRNVISPVMDNVDDLTADDVRTLSQEASKKENPEASINPITSTIIQRLSQTLFGGKE